jgi:radical SAM protein with 4Fe4S-binding SPASM domain
MEYKLNQAVYELTLRCNLHCKHCGSNAGQPRYNELSLTESLSVIRDLNDLGVYLITLNGGEPFLNPNWAQIGKTIRDYGIQLAIITNGFGLNKEIYQQIAALEPYEIGLSLDGGRDVHDSIRSPGSYDQVISTIQNLKEYQVPTGVITTVSKMNLDTLDEILTILLNQGIDAWQIQAAIPMGRLTEQFKLTTNEYKRATDFIHRVRTLHTKKIFLNGGDCMGIGAKSLVTHLDYSHGNCGAGKSVVGIHSNGDVVGCLSMMNNAYIEGNIRDRSLKAIWCDEKSFRYNRNPSPVSGKCLGCDQALICQAGCKSMNLAQGDINESPYCMIRPD